MLKHSDAQSSDFSPRIVPAASVQPQIASSRISGYSCGTPSRATSPVFNSRDIPLSTGPFCCGVNGAVNSRRILRSLQKSTNILLEYYRPLSVRDACGTPILATKRFTTETIASALFSRAPYTRLSTRGAVDEHHDVPRPPERSWVRSSGVHVDKSQQLRCSPRRVTWRGWPILFRPRTSRTLNQFPIKRIPCCFAVTFGTLA